MGYKIKGREILQEIVEIHETSPSITHTAKVFAQRKNIPFTDSIRRQVSSILERFGITKNVVRVEDTDEFKQASKREFGVKKYYIVTWEQNETPLHEDFFNNILAYKSYLDAEFSVILGRYKNPTSVFVDNKHDNWNERTRPYWDANRHQISKYLRVLADVKINPTRKYPLNGMQDLANGCTVVVGHPRLRFRVEPSLSDHPNRMLFTTGAITLPNYTDSSLGAIGEGSHKYGFVIIEVNEDDTFFIRQVEAEEDGSFIDLCHEVRNGEVSVIHEAEGLVCGDTHHWQLDPVIDKQNDFICETFNVKSLVLHDVIDGESCNNHKVKSAIQQFKRYSKGQHLIDKELSDLADWLKGKLKYNPVIPQANHNDRFDRVLDEDWRKDIHNALFYLNYTNKVLTENVDKGVVAYYLEEVFGDKVKTLKYTDSYKIGKYECSQHGDYGSNGAKGSPVSFRNLGIPIILAHSHSPYRADDLFYVGTNTYLTLDYNQKGSSSWLTANVLIAKNGIAQHIVFNNGRFTNFFNSK